MYKPFAFAVFAALMISSAQAQQLGSEALPVQSRTAPAPRSAASVQQYVEQLKASLQRETSFAANEPNGEALWANVRRTVENYLLSEWTAGKLLGEKPQQAFWVKCDRSTMTQNDLDNGRLIVLVGVAPVHPAEFVTLRITQETADARKRPRKK